MLGVELHSRGEYAKSQIAGDEAAWTALSQGRDQFYVRNGNHLGKGSECGREISHRVLGVFRELVSL
jgi:hypothetical protein